MAVRLGDLGGFKDIDSRGRGVLFRHSPPVTRRVRALAGGRDRAGMHMHSQLMIKGVKSSEKN